MFDVMKSEALNIDDEGALQGALKAISNSVRSDGLNPTLIVCDAMLRFRLLHHKPTQTRPPADFTPKGDYHHVAKLHKATY